MRTAKKNNYIINFYKRKIREFGPNNKGLAWESKYRNELRYLKIKNIIKKNYKYKFELLDFGCGISGLHQFLKKNKIEHNYTGIDTSKRVIEFCRKKFKKNRYYNFDILNNNKKRFGSYDIVVLNGIFTVKDKMKNSEMYTYITRVLKVLKNNVSGLMIINFLTDKPDWKNEKNFYPNNKVLKSKLRKEISNEIDILKLPKIFENIFVLKLK